MLRGILNAVPMTVLMVAVVGITLALVVGLVWLIRRFVPATREGFHAEISAPPRDQGGRRPRGRQPLGARA